MSRLRRKATGLPIVNDKAAAIDIGSRFHVVAVPPDLCDKPVQTFQAFTSDLERMADWIVSLAIKTVAMESTGVYWIPTYVILEGSRRRSHRGQCGESRAVPGRKSDVNVAQWLHRLHACGLLCLGFRPSGDIAALRANLRLRERHLNYAAAHIQHMQKTLTFMNLQLHHFVTGVTGGDRHADHPWHRARTARSERAGGHAGSELQIQRRDDLGRTRWQLPAGACLRTGTGAGAVQLLSVSCR